MKDKRSQLRQVRITVIADKMLDKLVGWRVEKGDLIDNRQTVTAQLIIREYTREMKARKKAELESKQ